MLKMPLKTEFSWAVLPHKFNLAGLTEPSRSVIIKSLLFLITREFLRVTHHSEIVTDLKEK